MDHMPFCLRDSSICRFWSPQRCWSQVSTGTKGQTAASLMMKGEDTNDEGHSWSQLGNSGCLTIFTLAWKPMD